MTRGSKPLGTHYIRVVLITTNGAVDAWEKQNASKCISTTSTLFQNKFSKQKSVYKFENCISTKRETEVCVWREWEMGRRSKLRLKIEYVNQNTWIEEKKPRKCTNEAVRVRICSLTFSRLWLNEWKEPTQSYHFVSFPSLVMLETSHHECDKERNSWKHE